MGQIKFKIMETLEHRVDYFKRQVKMTTSIDGLEHWRPFFERIHEEAQEDDWTEEQIDDFGYTWMAHQIHLFDLEMEQEKMEEEKRKGNEANEIEIDHKAIFKAMCGL